MKSSNAKNLRKIFAALEQAKGDLEEIMSEIQDAYDSKSDKWRESEAGEAAQAEIDAVGNAYSNVESALDELANLDCIAA